MNPIAAKAAAKAAEVAAKAALKEARAWIAKYHVEALWDDQLIALAQHGTDGERRLAFPEINRRLKERGALSVQQVQAQARHYQQQITDAVIQQRITEIATEGTKSTEEAGK